MAELTKKSILVIENDEKILDALSARFRAQDMLVITAMDGYDGYTRACKESPDLIISETLLPSMDGFRLSRLLKFDERFKHIPILLLTKKSFESVQIMFNSSGADKIMSKPFRFGDLKDKIQELLS
jgi:DNA-binding response OmpR family regulator